MNEIMMKRTICVVRIMNDAKYRDKKKFINLFFKSILSIRLLFLIRILPQKQTIPIHSPKKVQQHLHKFHVLRIFVHAPLHKVLNM